MEYQLGNIFKRFVALVIDGFLIVIAVNLLSFPFGLDYNFDSFMFIRKFAGIFFFIALAYYSYFESSDSQATFGKQVMHLKVFDENGNRLTAVSYTHLTLPTKRIV